MCRPRSYHRRGRIVFTYLTWTMTVPHVPTTTAFTWWIFYQSKIHKNGFFFLKNHKRGQVSRPPSQRRPDFHGCQHRPYSLAHPACSSINYGYMFQHGPMFSLLPFPILATMPTCQKMTAMLKLNWNFKVTSVTLPLNYIVTQVTLLVKKKRRFYGNK